MVLKNIKVVFLLTIILFFLFKFNGLSFSQTTADQLQAQIKQYEQKIADLQGQEKTLSSQIAIMDSQIKLTEYRIEAAQEQITSLTLDIDTASKKVNSLQKALDESINVLLNRIVATYEVGTIQPLQILLTSGNASDFLQRLNYLKLAQAHDKQLIYDTQQAKTDYANQKTIFQDKKKQVEILNNQLQTYTNQLNQEKKAKNDLLAQTKGSEATYQSLLSQVKTQLAALSNFSKSVTGGVSIIPHEEKSDDWGKYYNQRDANWGNNLIGLSSENISSVGCLLTSYAMVSSHFGASISPADVAANSGNFWYSTAYFLKPGPSANGHSASSTGSNPSLQELRDALNSGKAVIAGLSYDGGPIADHWLVLRSVDGDSFRVNDPLYQGAMNVSLNDHYSGLKIVEARIYN